MINLPIFDNEVYLAIDICCKIYNSEIYVRGCDIEKDLGIYKEVNYYLLKKLVDRDIIISKFGQGGGYKMPLDTTIGEIVRALKKGKDYIKILENERIYTLMNRVMRTKISQLVETEE